MTVGTGQPPGTAVCRPRGADVTKQREQESGGHAAGLLKELACGRSACGGQLVGVALIGAPYAAATAPHAPQFRAE